LIGRWLHLASEVGIRGESAGEVWRGLAAEYRADGRFYHNLNHIQHMLDIADQLKDVAEDFTAVQLAIWFHDVVYDPQRSDNEAQSAVYAERVLQPLGVSDETLSKVSDLILVTKTHEGAAANPDVSVMLDADLAILGSADAEYDSYAQAIRLEYGFVPEKEYCIGRTAVLQRFLTRSPFYFTAWMREQFETAVIPNLTREIKQLEARLAELEAN